MFRFKSLGCVFLILASSIFTNQALAEQYWGLGLGKSSFDLTPLYGSFELDDAIAFKFVFGNKTDNTAFEMDMSFASYDWTGTYGDASHNALNLVLAGLGYLPLSESVDLFGKIGANLWSTTVDLGGVHYEGDGGVGLSIGGGIEFTFTESSRVRMEYQMLNGLGDGVDEGDITNFMLTAIFNY